MSRSFTQALKREVDVFAARDLVLLAPRAELAHDVGRHHVDDRGRRRGERREHLDVVAGLGAHVHRVAGRGDRGHDDRRVRVAARGLEQVRRPSPAGAIVSLLQNAT